MLLKKLLFLLFSIGIFSGCYNEINIDLPDAEIKPVVYGLAQAGKIIRLSVQKSISSNTFADTLNLNIQTVISLYVNHSFKEKLSYSAGLYTSSYIPRIHDTLSIKFQWQTTKIEAETVIPTPIKLDSVIHLDNAFYDNISGEFTEGLQAFFVDNSNEKNYYEIGIRTFSLNEQGDSVYAQASGYVSSDPIILQEDISDYEGTSLIFSDLLFNGKLANPSFTFSLSVINEKEWYDTKLYLLKVTEDYYHYQKTLMKNQWAQHPDILSGGIEFINVKSNIKNGFGIFKGFSIDSLSIQDII